MQKKKLILSIFLLVIMIPQQVYSTSIIEGSKLFGGNGDYEDDLRITTSSASAQAQASASASGGGQASVTASARASATPCPPIYGDYC